jgi:hypothetical protein
MTKLNNKLLAIFLTLGIVFFIVVVYMFIVNEIIPKLSKSTKHTVNLKSIKFIKNDYVDTSLVNKIHRVSESMRHQETTSEDCSAELTNLTDSITYVESNNFNLKTILAPTTIDFYDNSGIPQPVLNDKFKLCFKCDNKIFVELPIGDISKLLKLKDKTDFSTEYEEIKLTTNDKKIILFVKFSID